MTGVLAAVPGPAEREAAAVLVALAGPRRGEAWAVQGAGELVRAALQAAAGAGPPGPLALAVAGTAGDVPAAARALRTGGRLVAVAASAPDAAAAARAAGTTLLRVLPLPVGVAWLARRDP